MKPNARKIIAAPARGLKALSQMMFGRQGGLVWRFMPRSRFDYAREIGDGLSSSIIMAPIFWMARTFPEAPVQVLDSEDVEIDGHPMVQLLRRPNRFYSGIVLWMATLISWVLDGNAYWIKVRNHAGGVLELWYVPHWMMKPVSSSDTEFITTYVYSVDGHRVPLDPKDVVHFRYGLDPRNPRKGLSPLGTLFREIFTDEEASNFSASLLRNVGIPGLVISPEDNDVEATPDDVEATKAYVKESFGGDRRGEPLVMRGPTKVQQFGFSPEQMDIKMLRRVPEERVTAALGLPAIVVGFGAGLERSTFANYAEAREAAYEQNIIPTQRLMAEELRHQLLPDFEDRPDEHEVAFDLSNVRVLQEDRSKEATRLGGLYKDGVITRSEARKAVGEESGPADDVYAVPIAVQLVPATEAPGDRDPLPPEEAAKRIKTRGIKVHGGTPAQNALITQFQRDASRLQEVFAQELELDFDKLGMQAQKAYEGLGVSLASRDAATKGNEQSDSTIIEAIEAVLGIPKWKAETLEQRFATHYGRVAQQTTDSINGVFELGVSLPDTVARKIIAEGGRRLGLVDIDKQTKQALFRALTEAREQGLGAKETGRLIRQYVGAGRYVNAGAKYRAESIARSETMHAQRMSSLEAYKAAETVMSVTIYDGLLEDSDAECVARNGETASFEEAAELAADEHPMGTLSFAPNVGVNTVEVE